MDVDTVKLKFQYKLPNNEYFREKIRGKQAWTNNTWREEQQREGIYMPKYWIEEDYIYPSKTYFYFEASISKLIKGENITSFDDNCFDEVISTIQNFCSKVGIKIFSCQIENAIPTLLSIGHNINLGGLCHASVAVKVLNPFDYKPHCSHRIVNFSDYKNGGNESILSQASETIKAYDKTKEVQNHGKKVKKTRKEFEIAELIKNGQFKINGESANEILRIELTLKTKRKIGDRLKPYLRKQEPNFKNIFKKELWKNVLRDEINRTFNHPLQKTIFLSLESQPYIDSFLDQHYSHIQTKDTMRGLLMSLHDFGLAETRRRFLEKYRSRQTWYNYLKRLKGLEKHFDWSALSKLDSVKVHSYVLGQFGISNQIQQQLDLFCDTNLSKKIDIKLRNAKKHGFD